jgi:DNA invertase Pin-like site-specific DNA recombinase
VIAAIYARRSKEQRGTDEEAKSVALQVRNARAFAAECGWNVAEDHIYTDDAVSGADVRKLRARQRLLDVISNGAPFQVLIVREESRFSRRGGDVAFAELKQIARAGVEVWFYQERKRFTFGTFGENIVGFVKAEAAADYRRQIARWTHDAMVRRARAGHVRAGACSATRTSALTGMWSAGSSSQRRLWSNRSSTGAFAGKASEQLRRP